MGQEGIMFLLNQRGHDLNCGTYGRGAKEHTFVNPETGKWVPNVVALYDNGKYIMNKFGVDADTSKCNFYCGVSKFEDGTRNE